MKHRNFNQPDRWHTTDSFLRAKQAQENMIKKGYPDYQAGDWVLWIVPEIFCEYQIKEIVGLVKIIDKQGKEVEISHMKRQPYPNKGIHQLSMKSGRKRLYGIPLVFKTYEELCNIKTVEIRWDIYSVLYLNDKPFDLKLTNCIVNYELDFVRHEQESEYRFFTVFSKESMEISDKNDFKPEEFDHAVWFGGTIVLDNENSEEAISIDFTDFVCDKPRETSSDEDIFCDRMEKEQKSWELINKHIQDVEVDSEILWEVYWFRQKEKIVAAPMADILPESCFGFERK